MNSAKLYIDGYQMLSIQPTYDTNFRFGNDEIAKYSHRPIPILDPNYKEVIPPLQLRRMNKSMRMALYCGQKASQKANSENIHAIIVGSGLGCLKDSEKFVSTLLEDENQVLNPTPFIQSTHNMAAATLAIALNCTGYNMTYVSGSHSFESAILDTQLYLSEHTEQTVLLGGVDEIGEITPKFWEISGISNQNNPAIPTLPKSGIGEIDSEGAAFFVIKSSKSAQSIASILGVEMQIEIDQESHQLFILNFLKKHNLNINDIDVIMIGYNGDQKFDEIYESIRENTLKTSSQKILGYKHVFGEFDTVPALGLGLACHIFENGSIPEAVQLNGLKNHKKTRYILMYQHRRAEITSVILLKNEVDFQD